VDRTKGRLYALLSKPLITCSSDRRHMAEVYAYWSWHSAKKPAPHLLLSMPDIDTDGRLPAVFCNAYHSPQSCSEVSAKMPCRAGWSHMPRNKQSQMDRRKELNW